tara:strand:- start:90 stop:638 length:549 start_codon:yes stop_codon:yes gene_type:complete
MVNYKKKYLKYKMKYINLKYGGMKIHNLTNVETINEDMKDRFMIALEFFINSDKFKSRNLNPREIMQYKLKCLTILDKLKSNKLIAIDDDLVKGDEFLIHLISTLYKQKKHEFTNENLFKNKICVKCYKKSNGEHPLCNECLQNEISLQQGLTICPICEEYKLISSGAICEQCFEDVVDVEE